LSVQARQEVGASLASDDKESPHVGAKRASPRRCKPGFAVGASLRPTTSVSEGRTD
jgi:hypothetical protein